MQSSNINLCAPKVLTYVSNLNWPNDHYITTIIALNFVHTMVALIDACTYHHFDHYNWATIISLRWTIILLRLPSPPLQWTSSLAEHQKQRDYPIIKFPTICLIVEVVTYVVHTKPFYLIKAWTQTLVCSLLFDKRWVAANVKEKKLKNRKKNSCITWIS